MSFPTGNRELEYYKSMGGTIKRGYQILKFQWGEAKEGEHNFLLKFSGVKNLGGNYGL